MNNNKVKKIALLSLLSSCYIYLNADNIESKCSKDVENKLLSLSATVLHDSVIHAGMKAFVDIDSLIEHGFSHQKNKDSFAYWQGFTACSHAYISEQIENRKSYKIYTSYLKELTNVMKFVQTSFNLIASDNTLLQSPEFKKTLSDLIKFKLKLLKKIQAFSLRTIAANTSIPQYWKDDVPNDHKKILPNFSRIFDSYKTFKKRIGQVDDKAFAEFLLKNNIQTTKDVEQFLTNLEYFIYRLKEDYKSAWFGKSGINEKILLAEEILNQGLNYYPEIRTKQISAKLKKHTDKVSGMILAESMILIYVLEQLLDKIR